MRALSWLVGLVASIVGVTVVTVALGIGLVTFQRNEGVFAPVYGPDRRYVYYVARHTAGVTWGMGHEFFSAPANGYAWSDTVSLRRVTIAGGAVEVLESWPETPIKRRVVRNYQSGMFEHLRAQLRVRDDGAVHYRIAMSVTRVPASESYRIAGAWRETGAAERGEWEPGHAGISGYDEWPLHGDSEVMAIPGPAAFPPAIVVFDHATGVIEVLVEGCKFDREYPDGVARELVESRSHRAAILRIREMERVHAELTAKYLADGLMSNDAALRVIDDMKRLGYYPKSPYLTARAVGADEVSEVPLFDITEREMQSGIFEDIRRAVADPGAEVEKSMGTYVTHQDYTNSARLNAYLDSGGTVFRVRHMGEVFELKLERP